MPILLHLVPKSDPILREKMTEIKNFKDPELSQIIENMLYSIQPKQLQAAKAENESAAGMAANQWGLRRRVFIYTPDGSHPGARTEVMINPSYQPYPSAIMVKMVAAYEGCFSVPLSTGVVNRYESIRAIYYTPEGERKEIIMHDYDARVFQHETDHLDGKLYDGLLDNFEGPECFERHVFKSRAELEEFYNGLMKRA